MSIAWPNAAPGDCCDHSVDFSEQMNGQEGVAAVAAAATPAGLSVAATVVSDTAVVVWFSGGAACTAYTVQIEALTTEGRTLCIAASLWVGPPGLDLGF